MKAWEATVRKTQAAAKKKANTIFGSPFTATQPHVEEEDIDEEEEVVIEEHPSGEVYQSERFLPNGDYYMGCWSDNFPHGHGKYWWTDGCMYVGEWFRGKTMGKGYFSWPNGAFYDGNFKSGYMDGEGIYGSANGDTYRGSWMMNFKHGWGTKEYVSGDMYDGEWCRGLQEGQGKYQWKNGNYYVGEFKNGNLNGKGKLYFGNGNVYEGTWEDGLPKGNGSFRRANGSLYIGNWSKDPNERNGTYYPAGALEDNLEWDPQEVYNDLMECKICEGDKVSLLPSNKKLAVWRSSKNVESSVRPRRMSVDGRLDAGLENEYIRLHMTDAGPSATASALDRNALDDALPGLLEDATLRGSPLRIPKVVKKQGETISKGHKNYDLMLNLQLGIRYVYIHTYIYVLLIC